MRATLRGGVHEYLPLEELEGATVRVAPAPFMTVLVLTLDALSGGRFNAKGGAGRPPLAPEPWRRAALSRLRARDAATLAPLVDPRTRGWPSCLAPTPGGPDAFAEGLEEIAATDDRALATAVLADSTAALRQPDAWLPVMRAPDRWLRAYVDAMHRAWAGFAPLWRRSAPLLDREIERVSVTAARGATAELLDGLHPNGSIGDGAWRVLRSPRPVRLSLRDRQIAVTPMLASAACLTHCDDEGSLRAISYPLPSVWRAFDGRTPPLASLAALLGTPRATILHALDGPLPAGRLAERLGVVPSGVTPHLQALESAGLVARERQGRHVLVHRTARGSQLLALYDAP